MVIDNRDTQNPGATHYDLLAHRPELAALVDEQLRQHPEGVSEHELLQHLRKAGVFNLWISTDPTLALFQQHFAVMHVLYRLQVQYAKQGLVLDISPLKIRLTERSPASISSLDSPEKAQLSTDSGDLGAFYRDWSHFVQATPETVVDLLQSFWRRFSAVDGAAEALRELDLPENASWELVQSKYRRLAAEHHPDKGGNSERFNKVRQAYETLKTRHKPSRP